MKIQFLHGTQFGNAEMLAEDMVDELDGDFEAEVASLDDVEPADLSPDTFYVFVCSTYGAGEMPDTAAVFYKTLKESDLDLSGVRFAIFGLGDMTYSATFANGSKQLMEALQEKKATLVGERGIHDASKGDQPEDVGIPWLKTITPLVAT